MVGNSPKSDINPALAAGLHAVFVPHDQTWILEHEVVCDPENGCRLIRLELQNENLVALERGRVLASVPDLITVLDSETADAIASEVLRYGQRVTVIAFACDPVWRTERGIAVAGPRAFGYDFDYLPVEERTDARA